MKKSRIIAMIFVSALLGGAMVAALPNIQISSAKSTQPEWVDLASFRAQEIHLRNGKKSTLGEFMDMEEKFWLKQNDDLEKENERLWGKLTDSR